MHQTHLFKNALVQDYRAPDSLPLLILCEYASNALPPGYTWTPSDEAHFKDTHWAYDLASLQLASKLAKQFNAVLVYPAYSRLFVDVNRPIQSLDLIPPSRDNKPVQLNQDLTEEEEQRRLQYYLSYHYALRKLC